MRLCFGKDVFLIMCIYPHICIYGNVFTKTQLMNLALTLLYTTFNKKYIVYTTYKEKPEFIQHTKRNQSLYNIQRKTRVYTTHKEKPEFIQHSMRDQRVYSVQPYRRVYTTPTAYSVPSCLILVINSLMQTPAWHNVQSITTLYDIGFMVPAVPHTHRAIL